MSTAPDRFREFGFVAAPATFAADLTALANVVGTVPSVAAGRRWAGVSLNTFLAQPALTPVVKRLAEILPEHAVLRAVAFKKDANANWFVPAHQDRSIPIPSATLPAGFSRATRKDAGWQAEAPLQILAQMRNVRIFVDDAFPEDGPLEVIPGSHQLGRLTQDAIPGVVAASEWYALTGTAGDAVVLSPLLLHRSRRAATPRGRRVLQIECAPVATLQPLGFLETVGCGA